MASLLTGLIGLALSAQTESAVLVGIMLILIGGGGSIAMPPLAGIVLEHSPAGKAGVASAVSNTFRQVGGALAVAVFGVLVTSEARFLEGMQISLATAAVLALICLIASTTLAGGRRNT